MQLFILANSEAMFLKQNTYLPPSPLVSPSPFYLSIYLPLWLLCFRRLVSLVEITIRVDESECLSVASSNDQETERFLSTGTTGRRVSFNEAALYDHGQKAQEKGRRSDSQRSHWSHRLKTAIMAFNSFAAFLSAFIRIMFSLKALSPGRQIIQRELFCGATDWLQTHQRVSGSENEVSCRTLGCFSSCAGHHIKKLRSDLAIIFQL